MDLSRPKIPVTITFFHPNTNPPVYVATSLTNPPWQVVEMDVKQERTPSGDLVFEKKFDAVEAGEYQYKFRLGPGDWWVCDDNAPTESDPDLPQSRSSSPVPAVVVEKVDDAPSHGDDFGPGATSGQKVAHEKRKADADPDKVIVSAESDGKGLASLHPDVAAAVGHDALIEHTPADDKVPLLPHESMSSEAPPQQAPLFSHEVAVAPIDFKGDVPLFRHESIALPPGEDASGSGHKTPSLQDMMDQEDPNDPAIEPFPTRRDTIYEHIRSMEQRLEEDQSIPEDSASNSPESRSANADDLPPPSPLDSIQEGEEEDDAAIGSELNVQRDGMAERQHHARTVAVGSVPTPPLTPTNDSASTSAASKEKEQGRADSVFALPPPSDAQTKTFYEDSRSSPVAEEQEESKAVASAAASSKPDRKRQTAGSGSGGGALFAIGRWVERVCGGRGRATAVLFAAVAVVLAYTYQDGLRDALRDYLPQRTMA
ncbi:hypothetical protein IWZ00DRAFT_184017 [Phyllosticta capitalensis]